MQGDRGEGDTGGAGECGEKEGGPAGEQEELRTYSSGASCYDMVILLM